MTELSAQPGASAGLVRPADEVVQCVYPVPQGRKRELLAHLITSRDWRQVLVFTRTRHGANRLSEQLSRQGITAAAIHGNKSPAARIRALDDFKRGALRVLVATDVAGRSVEIEMLPHLVNFDLPQAPQDYLQRIGRSGCAGSIGEAISLASPEESAQLAAIEKLLGRGLERQVVAGFQSDASDASDATDATPEAVPAARAARGGSRRRRKGAPRTTADRDAVRAPEPSSDEERQPTSNAGQLFPSSGRVFGEPKARVGRRPHANRETQRSTLAGGRRRTG